MELCEYVASPSTSSADSSPGMKGPELLLHSLILRGHLAPYCCIPPTSTLAHLTPPHYNPRYYIPWLSGLMCFQWSTSCFPFCSQIDNKKYFWRSWCFVSLPWTYLSTNTIKSFWVEDKATENMRVQWNWSIFSHRCYWAMVTNTVSDTNE